ncbi:type II toxin-antitoxin system mRNA interferase toxin, RelE/StbE family [Candidatus Pacearchaeota archaeon CG_4_9_14_0_2_um_filter_30_8]|nr:MAG: type II toxin-antitoxin system mRNA interferase toxin, RelE/StbE family [Candidatus Pacearchaeota archaeon CG_4_9_14_0_2_um_filter_30_8]
MYKIILKERALRFFSKLDKLPQKIIGKKIEKLKDNPRLGKPLTGPFSGLWSLRIEKYRCIYAINDNELIVVVIEIGHRKNIY